MMKNQAFLDPTKQHTLTEAECELITLYRAFSPTKQQAIFKVLFETTMQGVELLEQKRKKKD